MQPLMEEPEDIRITFEALRAKYLLYKEAILDELHNTPNHGAVCARMIKGHRYYYIVKRVAGKIVSTYAGKVRPDGIDINNKRVRVLNRWLASVNQALYTLGSFPRKGGAGLALRFSVLERDEWRCQYCGRSPREHSVILHVDHIVPFSKGGANTMDNLITACSDCNLGKRKRLLFSQTSSEGISEK